MRPGGIPYTVPPKMTMAELRKHELAAERERLQREAVRARQMQRLRHSAGIAVSRVAIPATTSLLRQANPVLDALNGVSVSRPSAKPLAPVRRQSFIGQNWRQIVTLTVLAMIGYSAAISVSVGEVVLALFAVGAVVLRLESSFVFKLSFCSLLTTTIMVASGLSYDAAAHFATYAFLLIAIGIILQTIEMLRAKNDRSSL